MEYKDLTEEQKNSVATARSKILATFVDLPQSVYIPIPPDNINFTMYSSEPLISQALSVAVFRKIVYPNNEVTYIYSHIESR